MVKPTTGARKQVEVKAASKVQVPYAADGSCFHPGLRMKRSGRYHVGSVDAEREFNSFDEALAYLRKMDVPRWRRPNASGNWGIVRAVEWGELKG